MARKRWILPVVACSPRLRRAGVRVRGRWALMATVTREQEELAKDAANFCALHGDPRHAAAIRQVLAAQSQTCRSCKWSHEWPDGAIGCTNTDGLNRDEVSPDDFCSKWEGGR